MNEYAIIVAIDSKNGFAKNKKIPWYHSEDLRHFRDLTLNNICVMGRNTYLEIDEKLNHDQPHLLPNRLSVVLSNKVPRLYNALVFKSISDLMDLMFQDSRTVFFIGGKQIFDEALLFVDTIYITHIQQDYECDQFFDMEYVHANFKIIDVQIGTNPELSFVKYVRTK